MTYEAPRRPRLFYPDAPPVSAGADDDEFADASLGGAWTEWDPGSKVTVAEDAYGLAITNTNTSSPSWGGVRRALPSGDFAASAKLQIVGNTGNQQTAGFLVAGDIAGSPTTAPFLAMELNTNGFARVADWTDFDSFGTQRYVDGTGRVGRAAVYARMRSISGVYSFDLSNDGVMFTEVYSATPGFTPAHLVLAADSESAGSPVARFRFFRVVASVDRDVPILGRAA